MRDRRVLCVLVGLSVSLSYSAWSASRCVKGETSEPPFYLSGVHSATSEEFKFGASTISVEGRDPQGRSPGESISSETLRVSQASDSSRVHALGRGSRVKLLHEEDSEAEADTWVSVQVLSVEGKYAKFKAQKNAAVTGEKGFLPRGALRPVSENDVFVLTRDAALLKMPLGQSSLISAGTALRPLVRNGKYQVMDCPASGDSPAYRTYLFSAQSPRDSSPRDIVGITGDLGCWYPVSNDHFRKLRQMKAELEKALRHSDSLRLEDLEVNDWGLTRLPLVSTGDATNITDKAPDGSYVHYQGSDPMGSNTWGEPDMICGLVKLAREWQKECKNTFKTECTLQIGDISFITPGKLKGQPQDPLSHLTHFTGRCVDVRAFRKDGDLSMLNFVNSPEQYDGEKTRAFVRFLIQKGATPVYVNDPDIYKSKELGQGEKQCDLTNLKADIGNKAQSCPGHDNHIHFCLQPDRTEGCSARRH